MDDIELAINNIQNIESISFSDASIIPIGQTKTKTYQQIHKDSGNLYVPLLSIAYDGSNTLSLMSSDKHFDKFVKKVREVYLKEKDRPIPGHIMETFISIDDYTKKILLSDSVIETSELYSFYKDKNGYEEELISKEKEVFGLLPLISYIIDTNLSMFGKHFKSLNQINGFGPRGNYILYGEVNNIYTPIPIKVNKICNNTYELEIGNLFGDLVPLFVTINFNKTRLDIECYVPRYNYELLESYTYDEGKLTSTREIYLDKKVHYSKPIVFDKSSEETNISKVDISDDKKDSEFNKLDWFTLPWGANIGFKFIENRIDDETKTSSRKIQYIEKNDNVFINIVSAERRLIRKTPDFMQARDIIFDDVDKTMVGYRDNGITYISTLFGDDGATGEYKEYYAGKSFYHVTSDDFDNLNSNNLYPVGYDFYVYEQGDLLENQIIKNKVMGS